MVFNINKNHKGGLGMNRIEKTIDLQRNGGLNSSQALLTVFGEPFGMDAETAKMLERPWGGGMGHPAGTCGCLTGAILVLAQAYDYRDEARTREEVFQAVRELFSSNPPTSIKPYSKRRR
jgi:hypothetical protein